MASKGTQSKKGIQRNLTAILSADWGHTLAGWAGSGAPRGGKQRDKP